MYVARSAAGDYEVKFGAKAGPLFGLRQISRIQSAMRGKNATASVIFATDVDHPPPSIDANLSSVGCSLTWERQPSQRTIDICSRKPTPPLLLMIQQLPLIGKPAGTLCPPECSERTALQSSASGVMVASKYLSETTAYHGRHWM